MSRAKLEIEVKLPITDPTDLRARLRALGFRPGRAKSEINWLFDDARGELRRSGRLLRLRQSGSHWLLTVKGPRRAGVFKQRPEVEISIADAADCRALLDLLGYRETSRYARRRTLWLRPDERGEIAWDTTPFGPYLELEGPPGWIRATARALDLDLRRAEQRSYPELFAAHRATNPSRRPPRAKG